MIYDLLYVICFKSGQPVLLFSLSPNKVQPMTEIEFAWDSRQRSVFDSNKYMFEHKVACDVAFLIQYPNDGQPLRIQVHKYVLLSRSPVFCAQFCRTSATPCDNIIIDDIPADAFTEMLR